MKNIVVINTTLALLSLIAVFFSMITYERILAGDEQFHQMNKEQKNVVHPQLIQNDDYGNINFTTKTQQETSLDTKFMQVFADEHHYSESEIVDAGHQFFGKVSEGLGKALETLFRKQGRPTGYIVGQDAGGALIAGLRYGEGFLYTKYGDRRKVFWQGPSLGYDFGGEGNRTMILVYNLQKPNQIYSRFGGIQGSAYMVGGVGIQFLNRDDITLAPIRTGVGIRFGGNIGYLKFTSHKTWNPF
ncbi:MAG: hypothetical protein TECD_00859 [Hyphomicrobiaceae bacterium hypho_1]